MSNVRTIINKIILFILLTIFIVTTSYLTSYFKYNNKENITYTQVLLHNQQLKKELSAIRDIKIEEGILSKILIRDFYNFYNEIIIDVGTKDGVKKYNAVINEEGLVGVVYKTKNNISYVKLLSGNYNISVKVGNTYGNYNNGKITMVDKYSDINIGDLVYTSGLDNVPGDIYLGKVINIQKDNDNLGQILQVEYVDNRNLNYLLVKGK